MSQTSQTDTSLPQRARHSINRCNLPAVILGSLTFQQHPAALEIDGVRALHRELFRQLDALDDPMERADLFMDTMTVHFQLHQPEQMGLSETTRTNRAKADYRRTIRGWAFDPDSREAAVLKGWVESRFGLLPRYHNGVIRSINDDTYHAYQSLWATGLYNTNALEAQLDLLYTYSQYELARRYPGQTHITLYRGINDLSEHEVLEKREGEYTVILNNISSFSGNQQRADEFGDVIIEANIPLAKIAFFTDLIPGRLRGEEEYAVLGGVYSVSRSG